MNKELKSHYVEEVKYQTNLSTIFMDVLVDNKNII